MLAALQAQKFAEVSFPTADREPFTSERSSAAAPDRSRSRRKVSASRPLATSSCRRLRNAAIAPANVLCRSPSRLTVRARRGWRAAQDFPQWCAIACQSPQQFEPPGQFEQPARLAMMNSSVGGSFPPAAHWACLVGKWRKMAGCVSPIASATAPVVRRSATECPATANLHDWKQYVLFLAQVFFQVLLQSLKCRGKPKRCFRMLAMNPLNLLRKRDQPCQSARCVS